MQPATSTPLAIPRPVPLQRIRPPKENIPPTPFQRNHFLQAVRRYVAEHNPVPPLSLQELSTHVNNVMAILRCDPVFRDYLTVLINNELWRETLASVPFNRRLLLLPKCLRVETKCPAQFDEFGLVCRQCGLCSIEDLQSEAEELGYAVLVAEGSAVVMSLIQTGKIEAIIGVSCLNVLERAFPSMEAAAIPGVAIPLLQDDCADTMVDLDWVWDYIHLTNADRTRRLDLGALHDEVESWFTSDSLNQIMGEAEGQAEGIARQWLTRGGKRWRPFLTVAVHQALCADPGAPASDDLRKIAAAVECFHKASLVHDDIEDGDSIRYGEKTLHQEHGIAVALNVGDLLIGEGYRLIGATSFSAAQKVEMLRVASTCQRQLCRGQGAELCWMRNPAPLTSPQVLDIFRKKTAPAFEVALRLGAISAGIDRHEELSVAIARYSEAIGIAYQIRDDLDDWGSKADSDDLSAIRPSLLLAIASEQSSTEQRQLLENVWRGAPGNQLDVARMEALFAELRADERARNLLETYKQEAIRSLRPIENANIKGLLRRVIGKIFNDAEIKGWCKEFQEEASGKTAL